MNSLIIYDSLYGNTEKIAKAMGEAMKTKVISVSEAKIEDFKGLDLLIIGSPTHGGRAKTSMQAFLNQIPENSLKKIKIAAFDTRFLEKEVNLALRMLIKTIGYAAPKIADLLQKKGGNLIAPPEGFIVVKKEGPLKEGELERAKTWSSQLLKGV